MYSEPLTILMADDDLEDLELIEEALRDHGNNLHFHKVQNGMAVLEYLESKPDNKLPCLIVLDYNMPELNGSEVLQELRKIPRYDRVPKIVFSTSSELTHIKECKNNGAKEYFVKPTNSRELNLIVEKLVSYCGA